MKTSPLTERIRKANEQGRKALIPFLPAGFPDRERFWKELAQLDASGADIIEIGVPFSDPVADGPVVEKASEDCLKDGICLSWIFGELSKIGKDISAPIVLMGYMNPFYQYGLERLARDAADAGVAGFIVPDLPYEEAEEMRTVLAAKNIDLIALIGLNTSPERMKLYADAARGFVYFVSVLGTTGERASLPEHISEKLSAARKIFQVPLALGFGIKTPQQLEAFADHLDAVVFGSALINHIREGKASAEFMAAWR